MFWPDQSSLTWGRALYELKFGCQSVFELYWPDQSSLPWGRAVYELKFWCESDYE